MGVDADRQATASARRRLIIDAFDHNMTPDASSPVGLLAASLRFPRTMIVGADIDGIVSAMMLASVSSWRIGALVVRSNHLLLPPDTTLESLLDREPPPFGVDIFSACIPSASNHPVHFGTTSHTRPRWLRDALEAYDSSVSASAIAHGALNASAWAHVCATYGSRMPNGMPYKYPLGTAQLLLAALEVAGSAPRIYDRQYLPWLIANCDGGIDTIRQYAWNVETWWSALAAVAGPASWSEAIYRLATSQRPNEFLDLDRRLRYDAPDLAPALNTKWNLAATTPDVVADVVQLIRELSGWPDPFEGGVAAIGGWQTHRPSGNVLSLNGLSRQSPGVVNAHLMCAREALHVNFSTFRERGTALGWLTPDHRPAVEALLGDAPPEVVAEPEESSPTLFEGEDRGDT